MITKECNTILSKTQVKRSVLYYYSGVETRNNSKETQKVMTKMSNIQYTIP